LIKQFNLEVESKDEDKIKLKQAIHEQIENQDLKNLLVQTSQI